jgi:hypothetical protein
MRETVREPVCMDISIQSGAATAVAIADVSRGWRKLTNTFGFCEESRLDIGNSQTLRVQASLRAWPNIFGSRLVQYPQNVFGLLKPDWGRIELKSHEMQITFDLDAVRHLRLPRSGLPGVYVQPTELDRQDRVAFWFSLLVVFTSTGTIEYPDITEWDTQFLMGGRPGSSRRH